MIHPIVRLYDTAQKANAAVTKLKNWGFTSDLITVHSPSSDAAAQSHDALASAIASGYVLKSEAKIYAEGVRRGRTLVAVRAPLGLGAAATYLLDSEGPVHSGVDEGFDGLLWDEAAPFSSMLRWPVLTKHHFFGGIPMLTSSGRTLCSKLGFGELSASPTPTTGGFMPLLSDNAAPFSSMLKLPLLR